MTRITTVAMACLFGLALAGCTIAPTAAPGAPATPQGNVVKDRAMTGQTE